MTNVSIRKYIWNHEKKPRGLGNWAFKIGNDTHWFYATYSEAKKMAIKYAKNHSYYTIELLP